MLVRRRHCLIATMMLLVSVASVAPAQERGDPIGPITKTAIHDRAQKIDVGKTTAGRTACYFREDGGSHVLDIGLTVDGAFLRLETADMRDATPTAPLRIFAGKQIERGGTATDEFTLLQPFAGKFDYYIPEPEQGGLVILTKDDATAFFGMVARARMNFVVVQSAANPKMVDYFAIYEFKTSAIPALLSCAKARIQ